MINRNNLFLFYTGEHSIYTAKYPITYWQVTGENHWCHVDSSQTTAQQYHVHMDFKKNGYQFLLAKQPRVWNGKSKRSLSMEAAPVRISLSLLHQCSPQRCLTSAPHLQRRQEGGKQRLQTAQNCLHCQCFGQLNTISPMTQGLWGPWDPKKFLYWRGCQVVRQSEAPGGGDWGGGTPAVWFWYKATSLMYCGQQGAYQQPLHTWPQSVHSLCLTWRQTTERQLTREKAKREHSRPSFIKAETQMPKFHQSGNTDTKFHQSRNTDAQVSSKWEHRRPSFISDKFSIQRRKRLKSHTHTHTVGPC